MMTAKKLLTAVGLAAAIGFPAGAGAAEHKAPMMHGKQATEHAGQKASEAGAYILSADKLEGMTLTSKDGKDVGSVNKIFLNTKTGRIEYVVVASGGVLGVGDKKYVVPWMAMDVRKTGERWSGFVARMDAEKLKAAPEWRPDMTSEYHYSIWNWWGLKPGEQRG